MSWARVRGPGHPDVACDVVAATIVEEYVRRDPKTRIDVRVSGGQGVLFVAGSVQSTADFDVSDVVSRSVGALGVIDSLEPFITIEPMPSVWAPDVGARDLVHVVGYATGETESFLPMSTHVARVIASGIERLRTGDPEWFWLGPDYEVVVSDRKSSLICWLRVEHSDSISLADVRERIHGVCIGLVPSIEVRVNVAGEEHIAGFRSRIGSSGRASSFDGFGMFLPVSLSGVGREPVHPLNAGSWFARSLARELVARQQGSAIMVHAVWSPMATRPEWIHVRNERGADLSALVSRSAFDLADIPGEWIQPGPLSSAIRSGFDATLLPWEDGSSPSLVA